MEVEGVQCYVCSWSPADSSKCFSFSISELLTNVIKNELAHKIAWMSALARISASRFGRIAARRAAKRWPSSIKMVNLFPYCLLPTVDFFLWCDCLLGWSTISLFEYYYTRQPTIIHDCLRLGVVTGRLDFFYRNCAANTSSITGTCVNETSKAITKVCPSTSHGVNHHSIICVIPLFCLSFQQEICNCDSNYCNQSSGGLQQQLGVILSGILALLMIQF